jgi:uncharacterized protein YneF (UPF0154 family)
MKLLIGIVVICLVGFFFYYLGEYNAYKKIQRMHNNPDINKLNKWKH